MVKSVYAARGNELIAVGIKISLEKLIELY